MSSRGGRSRTNWGGSHRSGSRESNSSPRKERPKLVLSLSEFSEQVPKKQKPKSVIRNPPPSTATTTKAKAKKRERSRSPSLPAETDAEAAGLCIVCNTKLTDGMCLPCFAKDQGSDQSQKSQETELGYNTQRQKGKKKAKVSQPRPKSPDEIDRKHSSPEDDLFKEVGQAKSWDEKKDGKKPKTILGEAKGKTPQLMSYQDKQDADRKAYQSAKFFDNPKRPRATVYGSECDKCGGYVTTKMDKGPSGHISRNEMCFCALDAHETKEKAKPSMGGGKGAFGSPDEFKKWQKRLEDFPDVATIICDAGENKKHEPMLIFVVEKRIIKAHQLQQLEALRTERVASNAYKTASRVISRLLFGFKDIEERRQAFEQAYLESDECDNVDLEMAKFSEPGAWFDEYRTQIIDPSNPMISMLEDDNKEDVDDIQDHKTMRMYRLADFWENFNDLAEPYAIDEESAAFEIAF